MSTSAQVQRTRQQVAALEAQLDASRMQLIKLQQQEQEEAAQKELDRRAQPVQITQGELEDMQKMQKELKTLRDKLGRAEQDLDAASKINEIDLIADARRDYYLGSDRYRPMDK
jgi:hypothetical protein